MGYNVPYQDLKRWFERCFNDAMNIRAQQVLNLQSRLDFAREKVIEIQRLIKED